MQQEMSTSDASSIWIRAFVTPTNSGFWQMVRFGLTGGLATIMDYAIMLTLFSMAHATEHVAVAAGYSTGLVICYILSVIWVFPQRSVVNKRLEFAIFVAIGIAGLLLTEYIVQIGLRVLRADPALAGRLDAKMQLSSAKFIAIVIVFFFNFVVRKAILFRSPKKVG